MVYMKGTIPMTITMTRYGFCTLVPWTPEETIERVTEALKDEGFGILTTIDVQQTLKEKLDVDTEPYMILGACNPQLAHQALEREPDIGMLLPCNVIVAEADGETRIGIMDPEAALNLADNPAIAPIAAEARQRLRSALERLDNESRSS